MERIINVSLQILPQSKQMHYYKIIDRAIEVIQKSGLKYKVCPMETVIEGKYEEIMPVIDAAIKKAYELSDKIFVNIRMQIDKDIDVSIDEKLKKYQ